MNGQKITRKMLAAASILISSSVVQAETIRSAMQHVVNTNPEVVRAGKICRAANEAWAGAYGGYLPSVDVNAGIGRERSHNSTTRNNAINNNGRTNVTFTRQEFGAELRQMLFDGFFTPSEVRRNKYRTIAADWFVLAEANEKALMAAEAYINVVRHRALLASAKENLLIHQRTRDMINRRSESGVSRNTDAIQARGRTAQAAANVKAEEGHLKDAIAYYFRVVGRMPKKLSYPSIKRRWVPKSKAHALKFALKNHPRLKSANADIEEARGQYEASKAPFYPRVDAVVSMSRHRDIDGVEGRNEDYVAMLRGNWNLFNGLSDWHRSHETAYQTQEAIQTRNNTYRQIVEQLNLSWISYKTNAKLIPDYRSHMDAALSTIDAYGKQFQLGQRTLLDLLNTENEYMNSKRIWINSRYDMLFAKYRILAAMGCLLDHFKINVMSGPYQYGSISQVDHGPTGVDTPAAGDARTVNDAKRAYRDKTQAKSAVDEYTRRLNAYNAAKKKPATLTGVKPSPRNQIKQTSKVNVGSNATTNKNYTIQILSSSSKSDAQRYVRENNLSGKVGLLESNQSGKTWYQVVYGNYSSYRQAQSAIGSLPNNIQSQNPWIRTVTT